MSVSDSGASFAELWEQYAERYPHVVPQRGDVRDGVILHAGRDEVLVDIGAKQDAVLSTRELQSMTPDELAALQVGESTQVYVVRDGEVSDRIIVSLRLAAEQRDWQRAAELVESGEIVKTRLTGYNKGGLLCSFGRLQGFIPASQVTSIEARRLQDHPELFEAVQRRELVAKVLEVNQRRRRLIMSERAAMHEWRAQQRQELFASLQVGDRREGVVSNLASFGAFVDLGGADGLVHLSEMSWGRLDHPGQMLRVGDPVTVQVLNVDPERERIGLSIKRLEVDPWTTAGDLFVPGELVQGTVSHIVKFGAFVGLTEGIEGLIHVSELAEGDFGDPGNVISEGEQVTVLVLGVDPGRHRIALSLRQVPDGETTEETPDSEAMTPETDEADEPLDSMAA